MSKTIRNCVEKKCTNGATVWIRSVCGRFASSLNYLAKEILLKQYFEFAQTHSTIKLIILRRRKKHYIQ